MSTQDARVSFMSEVVSSAINQLRIGTGPCFLLVSGGVLHGNLLFVENEKRPAPLLSECIGSAYCKDATNLIRVTSDTINNWQVEAVAGSLSKFRPESSVRAPRESSEVLHTIQGHMLSDYQRLIEDLAQREDLETSNYNLQLLQIYSPVLGSKKRPKVSTFADKLIGAYFSEINVRSVSRHPSDCTTVGHDSNTWILTAAYFVS